MPRDINDTELPISALVTSTSLHDSHAAIPLIKQTSSKFNYLYGLMDAAYDIKQINEGSIDISVQIVSDTVYSKSDATLKLTYSPLQDSFSPSLTLS